MGWDILDERISNFKIEGKKIPYSHYEFDREVTPPHLMSTEPSMSENFHADNKVCMSLTPARLELTTDCMDKDLEKRIEREILFDISYEKERAYIQEEKIWNVSYYFTIKGD